MTVTASTTSRRRIMHIGSVPMLVGGLLIAIGSLLPWVATPAGSLSGTAGAGLWTLCAGTIALAGALLPYPRVALAHALVPGVIVGFIVIWQVARLIELSAATETWGKMLPGIGLVMVGGGAVVLVRAALRIWKSV